jgi:Putative auto-transporter adhesin, head GIN domain
MKTSNILLGIIGVGTVVAQAITAVGFQETYQALVVNRPPATLSPFPAGGPFQHLVVENVGCNVVGTELGYEDLNPYDSVTFSVRQDTLFVRSDKREPSSSYHFRVHVPPLASLTLRNAHVFLGNNTFKTTQLSVSRSHLFVNEGNFEQLTLNARDSSEVTLNTDVRVKQLTLNIADKASVLAAKAQVDQLNSVFLSDRASVQVSGAVLKQLGGK